VAARRSNARLGRAEAGEPELVSTNGARVVIPAVSSPEVTPALASTRTDRPAWCPEDIVDEWGADSFPASDPPANW